MAIKARGGADGVRSKGSAAEGLHKGLQNAQALFGAPFPQSMLEDELVKASNKRPVGLAPTEESHYELYDVLLLEFVCTDEGARRLGGQDVRPRLCARLFLQHTALSPVDRDAADEVHGGGE
uniref:Uncharacterized protein n=1 Tax=Coccolithus braarudii TaxID=221442 RepID=A0A7S0Q295_9EUKA|mmetsp:Transcript_39777/g.84790  ORF Transcript_39777/g.84790 Transcript_39777/m.84790 type:complete len:122 (+) Transcript_39777:428-793(+)